MRDLYPVLTLRTIPSKPVVPTWKQIRDEIRMQRRILRSDEAIFAQQACEIELRIRWYCEHSLHSRVVILNREKRYAFVILFEHETLGERKSHMRLKKITQ